MHGFYRDGKARFGRIFPPCRPRPGLPIVASAGIGNRENPLAVAGLQEDHGEERDHEEEDGEIVRVAAVVFEGEDPDVVQVNAEVDGVWESRLK